jgi:ferrous iron transport protein A
VFFLAKEGMIMMPLSLADMGEENIIKKVGGNPEVRSHLADLGFVPGGSVTVVTTMGGNLIVNVKDSRVAISKEMANKIMV